MLENAFRVRYTDYEKRICIRKRPSHPLGAVFIFSKNAEFRKSDESRFIVPCYLRPSWHFRRSKRIE